MGLPYDDRDGVIWYDGAFGEWRDAKLHVMTHGLHYADAVFEGERVYNGVIFKLQEHTERLIHSGRMLAFEIPYSAEEINEACRQLVARAGIENGYVRPIAWRGSEEMGVASRTCSVHLAIGAWQWPAYFTPDARLQGIKITMSKWRRPSPDTAPSGCKAAGLYMICTLAKNAAEKAGFSDALMLDYRGRVAETTGANVFLVIDGKLHTPTPDCFLDGITRREVIRLAQKRGLEVIERAIMPEELEKADEIFITGTAVEVTPVKSIDERSYQVGEITRQLIQDFDDMVSNLAVEAAA